MKKLIALTAVLSLVGGTLPVFAADITVSNDNSAVVTNTVSSVASTGGNVANGGDAKALTNGGNVTDSSDANHAGNDGSLVLGGAGGKIETGAANAEANVANELNVSKVKIQATPWAVDNITVANLNTVSMSNTVAAGAMTDLNTSSGGLGRSRVIGGNVTTSGSANVAGNKGSQVTGGGGGTITTGVATSVSNVVNILNRSITRIQK